MKKYFKYFLYGLVYLVLIFVFAIMFIVTAPADVIKPNNGIEPYQVVKIQLRSLKKNDDPFKNAGIEQTWEFAHPNNRKFTGPFEKFKNMLKGEGYSMLLLVQYQLVQQLLKHQQLTILVGGLDYSILI